MIKTEEKSKKIYLTIYNLLIAEDLWQARYQISEYTNFKGDLKERNFFCSDKIYQRKFDKKLKERFFNRYKLLNQIVIKLFC